MTMPSGSGITVRPVTDADIPVARSLLVQLGYALAPEEVMRRLAAVRASPDHAVLAGESDGHVIALLHLYVRPALEKPPEVVVQALVVDATCRKVQPSRGVKLKLLRHRRPAGDLAGKRIGVRNQGDPGIVITRTMLAEPGLKDDRNEYIAIGDGAPAGAAIDNDRVDAMVTFDTAAARIELVGTKLRYVPLTPKFAQVGSGWICVPRESLKKERKALVALFRGIAKSTLFSHHNLDAGIDLHWAVYPESRPKGRSEDEARKELAFILKDRRNSWMRRPDDPDQRMGAQTLAEWQANIAMTAETSKNARLAQELGDPNRLFTNELIDEVNAFDKQAVVQLARGFKL